MPYYDTVWRTHVEDAAPDNNWVQPWFCPAMKKNRLKTSSKFKNKEPDARLNDP